MKKNNDLLRKTSLSAFVIAAVLCFSGTAAAAAYIKFDGIEGEAKDKDHKKWSDLASFAQEMLQPGSGTGAIRKKGKVSINPMVFTKELDKSSPKIAEALLKGTVFPRVTIHLTASFTDAGRVVYYEYILKNVTVTSYKIAGSGQSEDVPVEQFALSFGEITVKYTEHDNAGKSKGTIEYTWKVK